MSIKLRLLLSVLAVFAMALVMFTATWVITGSQKKDAVVINLAGRQRMLCQMLGKETFYLVLQSGAGNDVEPMGQRIQRGVAVFEATHQALFSSGPAPTTLDPEGPAVQLPAASPQIANKLAEAGELWFKYKQYILDAVESPTDAAQDEMAALSTEVVAAYNQAVGMMQGESEAKVETLIMTQAGALGVAVLITLFILFIMNRDVIGPLARISAFADQVVAGDMDAELTGAYIAELRVVRTAMGQMIEDIKQRAKELRIKDQEVMARESSAREALQAAEKQCVELEGQSAELSTLGRRVNDVAQRVASASEELSSSADEQARGAQRQKDQSSTVATTMEEMTATVLEVARNASSTSEAANRAAESARSGGELVRNAVDEINSVSESTQHLGAVIHDLGDQAQAIGQIINVINDIADQTNLLALNAAIEAARAGDAGRGFAVVADEVRKLAEKTMTATKDVASSITLIQTGTDQALQSMEETRTRVQASTKASNHAGEALEEILHSVEDMTQRVSQIATAAEEQSAAAEEINRNVEEIADIARDVEKGTSQAASATRDLAELSQELLALSQSFSMDVIDASKLRESTGQMRGILPKLMQDFVRESYGEEIYSAMQQEMGNPVFLPTMSYPDQVLRQMADFIETSQDIPSGKIFEDFGMFTVPKFSSMYTQYFRTDNLKEFIITMNETHDRLAKNLPGIKPPRFEYEDKGDTLAVTYISDKGYDEYFVGILKGTAAFFNQQMDISPRILPDGRTQATLLFH